MARSLLGPRGFAHPECSGGLWPNIQRVEALGDAVGEKCVHGLQEWTEYDRHRRFPSM